jgi:hypothetical protein
MAYFLTIMTGPEEGKTAEVVGECVIGRSGDAGLQIEDESVSWEHAIVRESGDKLVLENLSALGTDVNGNSAVGETKLAHGDEVQLSPRCIIKVDNRITAGTAKRGSPVVLVGGIVLAVAVVFIGVAWFAVSAASQVAAAISGGGMPSPEEWAVAYTKLNDRLGTWEDRGYVTEDFVRRFNEAWATEKDGRTDSAHFQWVGIYSTLLSEPVPGSRDTLIGTATEQKPVALSAIMGRGSDAGEPKWDSNDSYAKALVSFVRFRAQLTKPEK